MFTIVSLNPSSTVYPAIWGFQPWFLLLVAFLVLVGIFWVITIVLDSRKRNQNIKKTMMPDGKTRKVNGVWITEGRGSYEELCDVWMNEAEVKEQGKRVKIIGTLGTPKNVASQRIPKYYLMAKYMFQIRWPKNAKRTQQTEIMEAFYRENYSLPGFSFEELSGEERTAMTAILTSISSDQNVANAVVTEIQQKFEAFTKAINKLKTLSMQLYILIVVAAVSLFTLVYVFQAYGILRTIKIFMGIK